MVNQGNAWGRNIELETQGVYFLTCGLAETPRKDTLHRDDDTG